MDRRAVEKTRPVARHQADSRAIGSLENTAADIAARGLFRRAVYGSADDGRLLIGSTLEDVGFDHRVTGGAVSDLIEFAIGWFPELRSAELERSWAGLRPASANGKPIMGRVPGLRNAFVATGHYRSGWILAPATARLMSQLIRGTTPELDLAEFGHAACRNTSPKRERGRTAV